MITALTLCSIIFITRAFSIESTRDLENRLLPFGVVFILILLLIGITIDISLAKIAMSIAF